MNDATPVDVAVAAAIVAVAGFVAVKLARSIWHLLARAANWFRRRLAVFYADTIRDAMAPELAHMSTKVTKAIDELTMSNTASHSAVEGRLTGVEDRLGDVEDRLASLESRMTTRSPGARTRVTDNREL